jgi:TRAP-type C4-dicarboxylate transport system substrate-binding protein
VRHFSSSNIFGFLRRGVWISDFEWNFFESIHGKERRLKVKKSFRFLMALGGLSLFVAGVAGEAASQEISYSGPPITLRFSTHTPVTHPLFKIWNRFFEEVKTESKGKLLFQVYAAESLHGGKDGFKACVNNITDWTMGYPSWQAGSFNLTHVIEMPFAFPTTYVASIVAEELYPKYFKKEYEKLSVYLGDFHTTTPTHILSKKPIRKLDDLKGMKVRTSGGVTSDILKSLGGVPVFLPTPEIYNAFQRGMIDGVLTTKQDHVAFRTHEVGKYLLELGAYMIPIPTCLNQKTFDGLPKDLRKMFYSQLRRLSQLAPTINETSEKEGVEAMKKAGVEIISLSPAEFDKAQKMVEPLWEEFIKKNEAKGAPAKQMVEDFRSLSKKYSSWTPQQLMKKVTDEPIRGIIDGM